VACRMSFVGAGAHAPQQLLLRQLVDAAKGPAPGDNGDFVQGIRMGQKIGHHRMAAFMRRQAVMLLGLDGEAAHGPQQDNAGRTACAVGQQHAHRSSDE